MKTDVIEVLKDTEEYIGNLGLYNTPQYDTTLKNNIKYRLIWFKK